MSLSGNHTGLNPEELAALPDDAIGEIRERATSSLKDAGADHVIDTVAGLPAPLDRIEGEEA